MDTDSHSPLFASTEFASLSDVEDVTSPTHSQQSIPRLSSSTPKPKSPPAVMESPELFTASPVPKISSSPVSALRDLLSQEKDVLLRAKIAVHGLESALQSPSRIGQVDSSTTPSIASVPIVSPPRKSKTTPLIPTSVIQNGMEMNSKLHDLKSRPKSQLSKLDRELLRDAPLLPSQRKERDLKGVPPVSSLLQPTSQISRSFASITQEEGSSSLPRRSQGRVALTRSTAPSSLISTICLSDSEEEEISPPILGLDSEERHSSPLVSSKSHQRSEKEALPSRSEIASPIQLIPERSSSQGSPLAPSTRPIASVPSVCTSTGEKEISKSTSRKPSNRPKKNTSRKGAKRPAPSGAEVSDSDPPPSKRGCVAFFSHEPTGLRAWFYDGSEDLVTRFLLHTLERHPH